MLLGISLGLCPQEVPRSSSASPRKTPSITTLLLGFTQSAARLVVLASRLVVLAAVLLHCITLLHTLLFNQSLTEHHISKGRQFWGTENRSFVEERKHLPTTSVITYPLYWEARNQHHCPWMYLDKNVCSAEMDAGGIPICFMHPITKIQLLQPCQKFVTQIWNSLYTGYNSHLPSK